MGKHHIYSYRLTYFGGTAPCYYKGLLSLTICKRDMRRMIGRGYLNNPQDTYWFIGIVGKGLISDSKELSSKYEAGQILYVAKVKNVVSFNHYFTYDKFKNRKDRIYEKSDNGEYPTKESDPSFRHVNNNDVHKEKYLQDRDWDVQHNSKETYSLISDEYVFLDSKTANSLEKIIRDNKNGVLAEKQGHRFFEVNEDSPIVSNLCEIISCANNHGINNLPNGFKESNLRGCGKDKA